MFVCEYCLEETKARGEKIEIVSEIVTESGSLSDYGEPIDIEDACGWCDEPGNAVLYEIKFK